MSRPTGPTGRLPALVLAAIVAFGCQPSPILGPAAPSTTPGSAGAPSTAPGTPGPQLRLADVLRDAVRVDDIVADLARLQEIAGEHGGARPAGGDGHAASATFVAGELRAAGYDVELQPVAVPFFRQDRPSVLEITGASARSFDDLHDFKAMLFSASGEVTAPVFDLGFDSAAKPGDRNGLGCDRGDWSGAPAGAVVLVQAGQCRRHDAVVLAQAAGALAIVTAYPEWTSDRVLRPTLITPEDIRIPVIGATEAVGQALADAAAAGASVRVSVHTTTETRSSVNVIGETPGGDPDHVVMLGGHLDSVVDGPGINDDGSGTMTVLEIARELAASVTSRGGALTPRWKVRVAFWTGEEIGLLGSTAWAGRSDAPPLRSIAVYINLDMLGSANGGRYVYDGSATTSPTESGVVQQLFVQTLGQRGLDWQPTAVGSSDNVPFDQFGVPTGGLFSGANEIKTRAEADLFGGTADVAEDACFHLACDTVDRIDRTLLGELAGAAAWVVGALAAGEVALDGT